MGTAIPANRRCGCLASSSLEATTSTMSSTACQAPSAHASRGGAGSRMLTANTASAKAPIWDLDQPTSVLQKFLKGTPQFCMFSSIVHAEFYANAPGQRKRDLEAAWSSNRSALLPTSIPRSLRPYSQPRPIDRQEKSLHRSLLLGPRPDPTLALHSCIDHHLLRPTVWINHIPKENH